jgi:hypothetical protein
MEKAYMGDSLKGDVVLPREKGTEGYRRAAPAPILFLMETRPFFDAAQHLFGSLPNL